MDRNGRTIQSIVSKIGCKVERLRTWLSTFVALRESVDTA